MSKLNRHKRRAIKLKGTDKFNIIQTTYSDAPITPSEGSCSYYAVRDQDGMKAGKGEPPKRFGLTDAFKSQASWGDGSREEEIEGAKGIALVRLIRSVDPEDYARRCNWLEAFNLDYLAEDYSEHLKTNREYMRDRLYELRPAPLDYLHAGRSIIESAGIEVESAVVQNCLQLTCADPDIEMAFYAAMTVATNSSPGPADWDMIALALATFVHTLPHFKSKLEPGEFHQPFGEKTGWRMAQKVVM